MIALGSVGLIDTKQIGLRDTDQAVEESEVLPPDIPRIWVVHSHFNSYHQKDIRKCMVYHIAKRRRMHYKLLTKTDTMGNFF